MGMPKSKLSTVNKYLISSTPIHVFDIVTMHVLSNVSYSIKVSLNLLEQNMMILKTKGWGLHPQTPHLDLQT